MFSKKNSILIFHQKKIVYLSAINLGINTMADVNQAVQIDISAIIKAKNGGQRPSSILVYILNKFLHIKEINFFLLQNKDKKDLDFFKSLVDYLEIDVNISGEELLPPSGTQCIFVSNHPLGSIDGVVVAYEIGKHYPEGIIIPANDILLHLTNVEDLFIPVNKVGGQAKDLVEAMHQAYSSTKQMMMFPSGMVSRMQKGVIKDPEWKKNFVVKAVEYKRIVVPVYIGARNSALFYWVARLRKKLKINLNIEMMLLPHEMFRQRKRSLTIKIGNPIDYQLFDNSKSPNKWAQHVKEIVYKLK